MSTRLVNPLRASRTFFGLVFALLAPQLFGAGCGSCAQIAGPKALAIMPGVINRADNKSLRFAMLKYGLEQFCQQMTDGSAPLKLDDSAPPVGRFFPQRCDTRIIDEESSKSFLVQFLGSGYAWTNITQRLGFEAAGVIEYDPDFLLDDGTMYLYFRTKHIAATTFQAKMVENPAANLALSLAPGGYADRFGQQLVSAQLARGFTVLRLADGSIDFGIGIIEKGQKPSHPFDVRGSDKTTLANDRLEVHSNQRDFLGPFKVEEEGQALYINASLDGADAVDLLVLAREAGSPWLDAYVHVPAPGPLAYPPLMGDVVARVGPLKRALPVAKGSYYVVIDHTANAGRVSPPPPLFGDRAALVTLAVQLGDAP